MFFPRNNYGPLSFSDLGVEAIELLFKHSNGVIEALVQLSMKYAASTQDVNTTCRYIAEILGFFCSVGTFIIELFSVLRVRSHQ